MEKFEGDGSHAWQANQPLYERYYNLNEEEATFLKKKTGIKDNEELKRHIIETQAKAYAVSNAIR
jgi:hypothetical protein